MIVWVIIGVIILVALGNLFKIGMIKTTADTVEYVKEQSNIHNLNKDVDKIDTEWKTRAKQLNIDLDKATKVKVLMNYYQDKSDTSSIRYGYMWADDGAIGLFATPDAYDKNGKKLKITSSPLTWNIVYYEISSLRGVFRRNNVCEIQFDDGSCNGFAIEAFDDVKRIYEEAKAKS